MKFGKTRGQAFDTMMLVISVIVAIAILGVLMNILGGVGSLTGVQDPTTVVKNGLKNIVSSGYGTSTPQKIDFPKDAYIDAQSVIGDSPILQEEIAFKCSDNNLCGVSSALKVEEGGRPSSQASITVNQKTQAWIVVCGNSDKSDTPRYCVGIGRQGADARKTCTDMCLNTR